MRTKRKKIHIMVITERDYKLAKQALLDVSQSQSSINRIVAATFWGGRETWSMIVQLWNDAATEHPDVKIKQINIFSDGSATLTVDAG